MSIAIRNCLFRFKCRKNWDDLEVTEREGQRFCSECQSAVFFCKTSEDLAFEIELNNCVAFERHPVRGSSAVQAGAPQQGIGNKAPDPKAIWKTPEGAQLFRKMLHGNELDEQDRQTLASIKRLNRPQAKEE